MVSNHSAGSIYNEHNVALEIFHIIVLRSVIDERVRTSAFVIQEVHIIASPSLTNEQTIGVIVVIRCGADFLLGSESVRAVLVGRRHAALDCFCKLSAAPSESVRASVVIGQGIADIIVGDRGAVVLCQAVEPLRIAVGIGVSRHQFARCIIIRLDGKQVAVGVVGVFVAEIALDYLGKLILCIVGITDRLITAAVDRGDIAEAIIRVGIRIRRGAARLLGQARDQRRRAFAPRIVGIRNNSSAGSVENSYNIALQVANVVILRTVVNERICRATLVIQEVNVVTAPSLTNEKSVGIIVVIRRRTDFFLRSQPVRAVLISRRYAALDCLRKLSAIPSESVRRTVVVENSGSKHRPERRCLPT